MPFSTNLLAEFITYRTAFIIYWLNILVYGVLSYTSLRYATKRKFIKSDISENIYAAMQQRILTAQMLYAFGASLCFINTYWALGFILLVQLNYAVSPLYLLKNKN